MGDWKSKKEVVPFTAMAAVEFSIVGLHILYKSAILKGLTFFVFITYSYSFGTLLLLPHTLFFSRRLPSLKWSVLYKVFLLSLIGYVARVCSYKGLEYSSPALNSSVSTLGPAFTFILAVVFRMEFVDLERTPTQAKIIGTVVSVLGALVAVLYKGPTLVSSQPGPVVVAVPSHSLDLHKQFSNWALGGFLLAAECLLNSFASILQAHILKIYPAELMVAFMYCLGVTIITVPVSFMVKRELNDWTLRPDITLITVIYSTFLGPAFIISVHSYCLSSKGPLYTSIFKPFSIFIAAVASFILLGDGLHLGSVLGSTILLLGFYAVLWGKANEKKINDSECGNLGASSSGKKTALLQSHIDQNYVQ
ncbi:WAT1-related protein At4g15540-like [Humulus lupulus]|uniref:WAT1-related protein At4g15540-like n=1 Tax=Humulus lupulus TaxID=3486 RepID=UPI002B413EBC|nr:WAT1-related protein At4g15540-like [Humulus lupulus]